ncbi:TIGR03984 family CRISPR-associated protein [bacterium]|nr:TIGR03984 family CRISPR-associated protein [bacterium]
MKNSSGDSFIFKNEDVGGIERLRTWLEKLAKRRQLDYLLAHANDGVIWGHFQQGELLTSGDLQSNAYQYPRLCLKTLQQCRIFGLAGEVLAWRSGNTWQARFVSEPDHQNKGNQIEAKKIDEKQILLGNHGRKHPEQGFTELWEGREGLRHAVPYTTDDITIDDKNQLSHRICLVIHHYFAYDADGIAGITCSRLVRFGLHHLAKKPVQAEKNDCIR